MKPYVERAAELTLFYRSILSVKSRNEFGKYFVRANGNGGSPFAAAKPRSTVIAQSAVMAALIAVLTVTSFPLPPPLSAITLAPAAIFVASVFFGPRVGFVSAFIGSAIGFTIAASVGTIGGAPPGSALFPIFLLGIVLARGPEAYIIGILRRRNEVGAMFTGTIYETLIFFVIDFFYTYPVFLGLSSSFAYLDFGTLIDLVFIFPAFVVLRYLRSHLGVRYYDEPSVRKSP